MIKIPKHLEEKGVRLVEVRSPLTEWKRRLLIGEMPKGINARNILYSWLLFQLLVISSLTPPMLYDFHNCVDYEKKPLRFSTYIVFTITPLIWFIPDHESTSCEK